MNICSFNGLVITVILFNILCTSCRNSVIKTYDTKTKSAQNNLLEVKIPDIGEPSEVKLSELGIIDVQYIPFETNSRCLISEMERYNSKVVTGSTCFYIGNQKRILKFSQDGKFLCQIGVCGKGPGEYLEITDFSVDEDNNRVFILSFQQDIIYIYNLKGEFIKTIKCPAIVTYICCVEGKLLCYNRNGGTNENSFDLMDYEGNIIKSYPNIFKYKPGNIVHQLHHDEFLSYWNNGQLHVKEAYSDTVYIFEDQKFNPQLILNRGERRVSTESFIFNSRDEVMKKFLDSGSNYINEYLLLQAGNYVYCYFFHHDFHNYIISLNESKPFFKVIDNGIVNDIDGGPNLYYQTMKNDSTVFCWMTAIKFKDYIASDAFKNSIPKYPERKAQLKEMANKIKDNDNPIIILLKLKP